MPTGYTAELYDGKAPVTFERFILQCARAFGALVTMRDDPHDAAIPEKFEPADYHAKSLERGRRDLAEVRALSESACDERAAIEYDRLVSERKQSEERRLAIRVRYEAMLVHVRAWTPPTPDHDGLKRFMVEQLEGALDFDCKPIDKWWPAPVRQSGLAWRASRVEQLERSIARDAEQSAEEVTRADSRTAWVAALRGSLR